MPECNRLYTADMLWLHAHPRTHILFVHVEYMHRLAFAYHHVPRYSMACTTIKKVCCIQCDHAQGAQLSVRFIRFVQYTVSEYVVSNKFLYGTPIAEYPYPKKCTLYLSFTVFGCMHVLWGIQGIEDKRID